MIRRAARSLVVLAALIGALLALARTPKTAKSPSAAPPSARPSPTPRSSRASSRPRSAPRCALPGASTASANMSSRCACSSRTAPSPTAARRSPSVVADIKRRIAQSRHRDDAGPQGRQRRGAAAAASATSRRRCARLSAATARGKIQKSLEPQCLSGFRKDAELRIVHSDVFLVADRGDFIFYDCAYEELLQSLGPDQRHRQGAVDHVQRRCADGLLRRLRSVHSQYSLSPAACGPA